MVSRKWLVRCGRRKAERRRRQPLGFAAFRFLPSAFRLLLPACCLLLTAYCLLLTALCFPLAAQVITPRGKDAAVYRDPDIDSPIVGEVEADGRWRIEFGAAEVTARLPAEWPGVEFRFLLPARDTGPALMLEVRGPGRGNQGWVTPERVEISPAPYWKIPTDTLLFVPMRIRHLPPIRAASLPAGLRVKPCSYLLLVDREGRVAGLRPLRENTEPELEAALRQFRFAPVRMEGEPVHVLLALRIVAR